MNMKKILILLVFVVIVVCIISMPKEELNNNILDNENSIEVQPSGEEKVDENKENIKRNGIAIPGWATIVMPPNTKEVTVDFYNPIENKEMYYLTFELKVFNETNKEYESIYKSDIVNPGEHIKNIELTKGLEKGEYDAIVHVQPYKMDDNKTLTNNADMKTKIIVR